MGWDAIKVEDSKVFPNCDPCEAEHVPLLLILVEEMELKLYEVEL